MYQEFHRVKAFPIAAMRENAGKDILIASLHFLAHPTVSPQLAISNVMSISLSAISCIAAIGNALTRWNSWYTGMDMPLTLIRGSHGVYSAPSSRYIHTSVTMAYTHTALSWLELELQLCETLNLSEFMLEPCRVAVCFNIRI